MKLKLIIIIIMIIKLIIILTQIFLFTEIFFVRQIFFCSQKFFCWQKFFSQIIFLFAKTFVGIKKLPISFSFIKKSRIRKKSARFLKFSKKFRKPEKNQSGSQDLGNRHQCRPKSRFPSGIFFNPFGNWDPDLGSFRESQVFVKLSISWPNRHNSSNLTIVCPN